MKDLTWLLGPVSENPVDKETLVKFSAELHTKFPHDFVVLLEKVSRAMINSPKMGQEAEGRVLGDVLTGLVEIRDNMVKYDEN